MRVRHFFKKVKKKVEKAFRELKNLTRRCFPCLGARPEDECNLINSDDEPPPPYQSPSPSSPPPPYCQDQRTVYNEAQNSSHSTKLWVQNLPRSIRRKPGSSTSEESTCSFPSYTGPNADRANPNNPFGVQTPTSSLDKNYTESKKAK